ncbi:S-methyl-5-thioribose-1-phosphate isomerase [Blastopirellula marina]|uniref:Methylthioribose-1-phosphate isomerase n=1 Tax=Blastopirellula marina TaxID=124 RepID=A0A2S8FNX1_9BACT|nr:S-methyl-5-thioribose-1-phosphate isomerase [Blastopirellula marina]PQO33878.1 S-methyl-5-thioribose-1-phosphate isomerase [Blastopirellula marina]PTL43665.1 S-methyl-5-thioribose-1-phosphate isomerase [Blastopirellula marina]
MTIADSQTQAAPDPIRYEGETDGHLVLIDQTRLPVELVYLDCHDVETVWEAIKMLRVRGAPAIGIAAAYGVIVGLQTAADASPEAFEARFHEVVEYLAGSRPTAVNLFWALDRLKARYAAEKEAGKSIAEIHAALLAEARFIHEDDRQVCRAIGKHGAELINPGCGILTHCNAGGLATADYGTALAVMFTCHDQGKDIHVFVDETRPLLQGSRLTAWELVQRNIPATLICDNMAAQVMKEGRISAVITGADRIAANGDSANKIGTYGVAVLAKAHGIPFYIAAPISTFDLSLPTGDGIPIEQRDPVEIIHGMGKQTAPENVQVYNPAFDVTPAELIAGIITEKGVISPVTPENVAQVVAG